MLIEAGSAGTSANAFGDFAAKKFALALCLQQDQLSALKRVWAYLDTPYHIGRLEISVTSLLCGVGVVLLTLFISRSLRSSLRHRLEKRTNIDPGLRYTLIRLVHYLIISIGIAYALKVAFGLDLTSLAVVFSALSIGIGFGLQYIAADVASGFILLFERPVRVGDRVTIGEDEGDVQSINLRTTVVLTNDRISIIVPNSKLVSQRLINWSYGDPRARISIPIGVAYDSNVELVTKTLLQAATDVDNVLEDPPPSVQFLKFGDSSLDFRLMVWTNKPRVHPQIKSDINYRIERLFREAKIEIPYPQREFRVRGGGGSLQTGSGENLLADENAADTRSS